VVAEEAAAATAAGEAVMAAVVAAEAEAVDAAAIEVVIAAETVATAEIAGKNSFLSLNRRPARLAELPLRKVRRCRSVSGDGPFHASLFVPKSFERSGLQSAFDQRR